MDHLPPPLLLATGVLLGALGGALVMWVRHRLLVHSAISIASRRCVNQSRSTLKGQIAEQMAPTMAGFAYLPSDARFLGNPIDYVVFDGYTSAKDDGHNTEAIEIILLDIKYGQAKLSPIQRAIARAVEAGKVRFELVTISADGGVSAQSARMPRRTARAFRAG